LSASFLIFSSSPFLKSFRSGRRDARNLSLFRVFSSALSSTGMGSASIPLLSQTLTQ